MSTYPVDIKSTTASTVTTHNASGTGAPGRALALFVSKEGGQAATTVKIKDDSTVIGEFLIPATNNTNGAGLPEYIQFRGTGIKWNTNLKLTIGTVVTFCTVIFG